MNANWESVACDARRAARPSRGAGSSTTLAMCALLVLSVVGAAGSFAAFDDCIEQTNRTQALACTICLNGEVQLCEIEQRAIIRREAFATTPDGLVGSSYSVVSTGPLDAERQLEAGDPGPDRPHDEEFLLLSTGELFDPESAMQQPWRVARNWLGSHPEHFDPKNDVALLISLQPTRLAILERWDGPLVRERPKRDYIILEILCFAGRREMPQLPYDALQFAFIERLSVPARGLVELDEDGNGELQAVSDTVGSLMGLPSH